MMCHFNDILSKITKKKHFLKVHFYVKRGLIEVCYIQVQQGEDYGKEIKYVINGIKIKIIYRCRYLIDIILVENL